MRRSNSVRQNLSQLGVPPSPPEILGDLPSESAAKEAAEREATLERMDGVERN
jgi:hypothetical protein